MNLCKIDRFSFHSEGRDLFLSYLLQQKVVLKDRFLHLVFSSPCSLNTDFIDFTCCTFDHSFLCFVLIFLLLPCPWHCLQLFCSGSEIDFGMFHSWVQNVLSIDLDFNGFTRLHFVYTPWTSCQLVHFAHALELCCRFCVVAATCIFHLTAVKSGRLICQFAQHSRVHSALLTASSFWNWSSTCWYGIICGEWGGVERNYEVTTIASFKSV